jgi:Rieske Fe-S protein
MSEDEGLNRRSFLQRLLGGGVILAGLTSVFSAVAYFTTGSAMRRKYERLHKIGDIAQFPPGYSRILRIESDSVLVARSNSGDFFALSAICPHKGCLVEWNREEDRLICPCHAAYFDLKGNVLKGPAQRGLQPYTLNRIGDSIYLKV